MSENKILTILRIASSKWVEKVGKYVVEVEFESNPKRTLWISEKQLHSLNKCVDDNTGYATKKIKGYALFNSKDYFVCASNDYNWIVEFSKKVI